MSTNSGGGDGGGNPPFQNQPSIEANSMTPALARDGNTTSLPTTSAWAGGGPTERPTRMRSFAEIMAEQKLNRNILEIIMKKKPTIDSSGNVTNPKNLTFDDLGTFIFDTMKIKAEDCLRFNYTLGRYDTREVMFKAGVDMTPYLGFYEFMGHEITTRRQRNNVTKVTFKNVPLNIPDEEVIHLCEAYGKPIDYQVHYEKLTNLKNRGMAGGTRYVEVEMFPGASMFNFYWMEGPLAGDEGCRVTVLHPGQIQQCSNCLRIATSGCPGKGNGKACVASGTPRTQISTYMDMVKLKHGYRSLKAKYYEQFPYLGGPGTAGLEMVEREITNEDNVVPINPIEEKNIEIDNLRHALESIKQDCLELDSVKDSLAKSKSELKSLRWVSNVNKNKVDFARKVVEQSINICLADSTLVGEKEKELVTLYSTLVDEDNFELTEEELCLPKADFLDDVEKHLLERGENPKEKEGLDNFKTKILEAVKKRKLSRKSRADSFSERTRKGSNSSVKRVQKEQNGRDSSRPKLETK